MKRIISLLAIAFITMSCTPRTGKDLGDRKLHNMKMWKQDRAEKKAAKQAAREAKKNRTANF